VRQEHEFNKFQLNVTYSPRVLEIRVVGIFGPNRGDNNGGKEKIIC
jgi:hypothetical protein